MSPPGAGDGAPARRIRPRDWVVVAVVALIAAGLAGYLAFRPSDSGGDEAAPTSAPTSSAGPMADSDATPTTSSATRSTSRSTSHVTTTQPSPAGSASVTSPAGSASVTSPTKAPRIGPLGNLSRRIKGDPLALGRVDAPVVMVSFEDFRCPFCAQFSRTTEPKLIEKYVKTGVLRIEWRDLPIFGPQSTQAAIAGRAAAAQGKFWEFVRAVYADAPSGGHPDLPRNALIDYARQAGVPDIARFTADMDDPALSAAVNKDLKEGSALGVPSTPAFVIDGYPIVGAQPLKQFTDLIDTVQTLQ